MNECSRDTWLAGVDGCPEGWVVVFVQPNGTARPPRVVSTFQEIVFAPERPVIIAVDVPIGLPDHSPPKGRLAESEARSRLGDRKSSVFRIPSRSAVYASVANEPADDRERFFKACEIARKTSEDGKAFAKQGFYILDKVVEVDMFLRSHEAHRACVYETHPELAFWRLNGNAALHEPKKRKSRIYDPGMILRRGQLVAAGLSEEVVNTSRLKGAGEDDLLDAMACAVIAQRIHRGEAKPFPDPPPRDSFGLPMAIWA